MSFAIVEKKNRHALHGMFDYRERAERHLKETIPGYVARGYFMDKTLTADDFVVIELRRPLPVRNGNRKTNQGE